MTPLHVPAGSSPDIEMGVRMRLLVPGSATAGTLAIFEETTPPEAGPPLHVHPDADESFRVLSGRYRFHADGRTFEAGPGDVVFVPRGTPHCFANPGPGEATLHMTFTPAGPEGLFAAMAGGADDLAATAAAHGTDVLGPNPLLGG